MKKAFKKKKIIFLSRLYFPHIGGVETHIEKISDLLISEGHEVAIISEKHDKKLKEFEKINGLTIYRIPVGSSERKKKFKIWRWLFRNKNILKDADIVHIHDVFFWIFPLLFSLNRHKVFITFHGYAKYPISFSEKIQKKFAAKYCSGSIVVGEFINKWFEIASNAVIYGGVDLKIITAKAKKEARKDKNILYIGRLSDDMSASIYLEALNNLKKKGYRFNLEACGEGKYRKEFEKIGRVNGYVEDLDKYINNADLVFSSSYLTMLEILAFKKPIIAVYSNHLKKDYLLQSPFSKFINIYTNARDLEEGLRSYAIDKSKIEKGYEWSKNETWKKVLNEYKKNWKI